MTLTLTILWWHWVIALLITGIVAGILIINRARAYDFGTPIIGITIWVACSFLAIGITIGNCGK